MTLMSKNSVLKKLEAVYWHAFQDKKWHIVLQVVKLLGEKSGLFEKQRLPQVTRIADMTEEQLRDFMEALEKLDPELKRPPPSMHV